MQLSIGRLGLAAALLVGSTLAWACSPVGQQTEALRPTAAETATVGVSSSQDDIPPEATPDPVPDPSAPSASDATGHQDAIGTITALDASTIAVDGVVYNLISTTEVKGTLAVGSRVKLEYVIQADGSRTVLEAKAGEFLDISDDD